MTTCLITGGNGFIGAHLIEKLNDAGYNIIAFGRFMKKNPLFEDLTKKSSNIRLIAGDITDYRSVSVACKNADVIFHLAATTGDDPIETFTINGRGTLNILEAARQENLQKVIFASSGSVYFPGKYFPIDEEHPASPNSYYGISKLVGELYCKHYNEYHDVDTVILRLASVYGRGIEISYPMKAISIFLRAILNDETVTIYGSGDQFRDYVYIDDVVDAFLKAMKTDVSGEVFNIAGGAKVSTMELLRTMTVVSGKEIKFNKKMTQKDRVGDNYVFDISKAKRLLDFRPVPLAEGLKNMLSHIQ